MPHEGDQACIAGDRRKSRFPSLSTCCFCRQELPLQNLPRDPAGQSLERSRIAPILIHSQMRLLLQGVTGLVHLKLGCLLVRRYHLKCVGLTKTEVKKLDMFYCEGCSKGEPQETVESGDENVSWPFLLPFSLQWYN
jgi:hypothetical protein